MFDNRLKKLREARGISQAQAAEDLQLPYTTYVNYEKDIREPKSESLIRLAAYFGVTIDYLLGYSTLEKEKSSPKVEANEELLCILETLTDDELDEIESYIDYLVWKRTEKN